MAFAVLVLITWWVGGLAHGGVPSPEGNRLWMVAGLVLVLAQALYATVVRDTRSGWAGLLAGVLWLTMPGVWGGLANLLRGHVPCMAIGPDALLLVLAFLGAVWGGWHERLQVALGLLLLWGAHHGGVIPLTGWTLPGITVGSESGSHTVWVAPTGVGAQASLGLDTSALLLGAGFFLILAAGYALRCILYPIARAESRTAMALLLLATIVLVRWKLEGAF